MATLSTKVKLHIIQALACYDYPSAVSKAVLEEFGVKVDRTQIQKYDPSKVAGRNLAKKFKELFESTRASFIANQLLIPISIKNYRLRQLQKMFDKAMERGNHMLAMDILALAAKECTVHVARGGLTTTYVKDTGHEGLSDVELERRIEQNHRALELAKSAIATAAANPKDSNKNNLS